MGRRRTCRSGSVNGSTGSCSAGRALDGGYHIARVAREVQRKAGSLMGRAALVEGNGVK